jgi:hypothetical protein
MKKLEAKTLDIIVPTNLAHNRFETYLNDCPLPVSLIKILYNKILRMSTENYPEIALPIDFQRIRWYTKLGNVLPYGIKI